MPLQHHKIQMYALMTFQNLIVFAKNNNNGAESFFNGNFVEIIQLGIGACIDLKFLEQGYSIGIQDSVNDIVQHCDSNGLSGLLVALCKNVIETINHSVLGFPRADGSATVPIYNEEQKD